MATVIGYGMIGTLLLFTAVVETLKATNQPQAFLPYSTVGVLRYIFLGITSIEFFLIRFVRRMVLGGGGRMSGLSRQGDPVLVKAQKLLTAAIVTFAFCESVGIYGLVLFFIGGNSLDFYLFTFLSLIFFAYYFPRYPQWEEWANAN